MCEGSVLRGEEEDVEGDRALRQAYRHIQDEAKALTASALRYLLAGAPPGFGVVDMRRTSRNVPPRVRSFDFAPTRDGGMRRDAGGYPPMVRAL